MKKLISAAFLIFLFLSSGILAQNGKNFFQEIAGNWEGTLEYLDYSSDKRVKLKTYLTVTPDENGSSAEFLTVYDDFGRIIKDNEIVKIDLAAKKYQSGETIYQIESMENGKIVLLGSGQDGEKNEPIRKTISFSQNSLDFLKETRTPWQFRNQMTFRRTSENVLAPKVYSPAQLKEDFAILKKVLTELHPGIYRYQTRASLEKLFAETEPRLNQPVSEAELFRIFSVLTSQIHCGHTFPNPYNQNSLVRERIFGGKTYLPVYFRIIGDKFIVTENASSASIAKGSEIRKINGVGAREIIQKLLTVASADGKNTLAHRVDLLALKRFQAERYALFDWYFPLFFPLKTDKFSLEIVDPAGKKLEFETPAMTKAERTAEMAKRYGAPPSYDDGWQFKFLNDSTAYLKISHSITWRLKKIKALEFIRSAFAEVKARNIKDLIIDYRGNDGGDDSINIEFIRHLTAQTINCAEPQRRFIRIKNAQPDLAKYIETFDDRTKEFLLKGVPASFLKNNVEQNGLFEVADAPCEKLEPAENRFEGRAFVLSDASNASAAFQFVRAVKIFKLATIIGQETGGNWQGINGDNYFLLRLPQSKIEIDIPVYFQSPLAEQKDSGVLPDVRVEPTAADVAKGVDAELNYVLELIKKRSN